MKRIKFILYLLIIAVFFSSCALKLPWTSRETQVTPAPQTQFSENIPKRVKNEEPVPAPQPVQTPKPTVETKVDKPAPAPVPDKIVPKPPATKKTASTPQISTSVNQVVVSEPSPATSPAPAIAPTEDSQQTTPGTQTGTIAATDIPAYKYTVGSYTEYYNAVYSTLKDFQSEAVIKINNYDSKTYTLGVINDVLFDHPDINYGLSAASATLYYTDKLHVFSISLKYNFDRSRMISMRDAANTKAAQIIAAIITPEMTELAKERAIHDYVVNNTVYDYNNYVKGTLPPEVYTDYGVLINGRAVCEGYAKAMYKLLSLAGIENRMVIGEADGIPHAWNLVRINGVYTHVDATWDDPVTRTGKNVLSYNYFNISDDQIAKDHTWDRSKYPKGVAVPLQ